MTGHEVELLYWLICDPEDNLVQVKLEVKSVTIVKKAEVILRLIQEREQELI